jgi:hypothetical protein
MHFLTWLALTLLKGESFCPSKEITALSTMDSRRVLDRRNSEGRPARGYVSVSLTATGNIECFRICAHLRYLIKAKHAISNVTSYLATGSDQYVRISQNTLSLRIANKVSLRSFLVSFRRKNGSKIVAWSILS